VGTILILASWVDVVSPTVGWIGFAIAGVGVLISGVPAPVDRSLYPLTQEGFPVERTGMPVPPEMPLEPGAPLLAYSQGRWWRAAVVSVEEGGDVVVTYPGWDPKWMARLPRKLLQVDPDPSRRPMTILPGLPERWRQQSASEAMRMPNPTDRIQE
jgi:hypothetical protein